MNPLNDQILQALPQPSPPQQKGEWDDFLPPVEGKMGDGFTARRSHGQHNGGDIHTAPGTPIVAPRDMVYLYGGKGGTNLRNNDYWAHFQDPETGKEYRFAHMSSVPKLNPGDMVKQGEQWSTVGNIVDNPHVHMSVYNPKVGKSEDWPSALGLIQGQTAVASQQSKPTTPTKQEEEQPSSNVLANSFDSIFKVNAQNANVPMSVSTTAPNNNDYLNQIVNVLSSKSEPHKMNYGLGGEDNTVANAIAQGLKQRNEQQLAGLRLLQGRV